MATSDFLAIAGGSGANVSSQTDYAALPAIATGYSSGIAKSAQLNKTFRQTSIMAAVLARFIADQTGVNSVDDGTTATLLGNLKKSMPGRYLGTQIITSSGTVTPGTYNGITATKWRVRGCAAGGGGSGSPATGASTIAFGTPGLSGAYAEFVTSAAPTAVTVGAAGSPGGAGTVGGNGGNSTWGSAAILTLQGGTAGSPQGPVAPPYAAITSAVAVATGSLPLLSYVPGSPGQPSISVSTGVVIGGSGGDTPIGRGGLPTQNGAGQTGVGYGAGGGAGSGGASVAARTGGAGTQGIWLVDEFA